MRSRKEKYRRRSREINERGHRGSEERFGE